MGLTLPVDHGSPDVWSTILSTVFDLIDAHDHTTLRGAQVPMGGIKVDADKSWSFGGVSRAITDLKAVDFVAVAASTVTSLAGALFLNSADNNLYYRTTAGSNVQLTNGAALNVAAFAGGIGGDYSAVGALEIFDDATDSYWFQQQLGSGVRQYARMRCGDVDLYEYKAAPTAGPIPTNRVRLASPAALAASYALTMPGALPATRLPLTVSSTGVVATGLPPMTHPVLLAKLGAAAVLNLGTGGGGATVSLFTSTTSNLPVFIYTGQVITAWSVPFTKTTSGASTLTAKLWRNGIGGAAVQVGATQTNNANAPGAITLGQAGLTETAGTLGYLIEVIGSGTNGDAFFDYTVTTA